GVAARLPCPDQCHAVAGVHCQPAPRTVYYRTPGTAASPRPAALGRALHPTRHTGVGRIFCHQWQHRRRPGTMGALELVDRLQRSHQLRGDRAADGGRMAAAAGAFQTDPVTMSWIDLTDMLSAPRSGRLVAHDPDLDHAAFMAQ